MNKAHEAHRAAGGFTGVAAVSVVAGLAFLGIGIATDEVGFGIFGLALMLAYVAFLALGRRTIEPIGLLAGEVSDERQRAIAEKAQVFTANVLTIVLVGGFLVTLAMKSGLAGVFSALCAVSGVSFAAGLFYHSRRS